MSPEEQQKIIKSFLESLVNNNSVTNYVLLVKTDKGLAEFSFGDHFMVNGMLDFAKREMWLKLHAMSLAYKKQKQQEENPQ